MTSNLYCPISQEIMTDPVICFDGTTYQREHIQIWLSDNNTSPLTGDIGADFYNNDNLNNINNLSSLWQRLGVIIDTREDLNSQNIPIHPVRMMNQESFQVSQNDIRTIISLLNTISSTNEILMN